MDKVKKTLLIAIFVSLAAQIRFNFITDGFIIAMSVLVMSIFIYCYDGLSPIYIAFCSGIFSPLFRMVILLAEGGSWQSTVQMAVPDMVFFFSYGTIYTLLYRYAVREPKTIKNFPIVIFICDISSNTMELVARSVLVGTVVVNMEDIAYLVAIAICRTVLIQMILLALETHSNLLIKNEHDREYRKLIVQASVLESELHVMEKNATEIEEIMKRAFTLYKSMESLDAPKTLREQSLDISKNAHEVKGDYQNVINILKDIYADEFEQRKLSMVDIIAIEKSNLLNTLKKKGQSVEIHVKVKTDFYVVQYFKMMSIVRNLMLNGAEAMGRKNGAITVTLKALGDNYCLMVRDNGVGISEKKLETIFYEGYSTKFNEETGNVQRGLGLCMVKDYVENFFRGRISVTSKEGEFTEFLITIPKGTSEEATVDEILYH